MSEFLRKVEEIRRTDAAMELMRRAQEEQDRFNRKSQEEMTRRRAREFMRIMEARGVAPDTTFAQIGDNYRPSLIAAWRNDRRVSRQTRGYTPAILQAREEFKAAQGRQLLPIALGWVAASAYEITNYDELPSLVPGLFIAQDGETYDCLAAGTSRGTLYVAPIENTRINAPLPKPNTIALASDEMMERVARELMTSRLSGRS